MILFETARSCSLTSSSNFCATKALMNIIKLESPKLPEINHFQSTILSKHFWLQIWLDPAAKKWTVNTILHFVFVNFYSKYLNFAEESQFGWKTMTSHCISPRSFLAFRMKALTALRRCSLNYLKLFSNWNNADIEVDKLLNFSNVSRPILVQLFRFY